MHHPPLSYNLKIYCTALLLATVHLPTTATAGNPPRGIEEVPGRHCPHGVHEGGKFNGVCDGKTLHHDAHHAPSKSSQPCINSTSPGLPNVGNSCYLNAGLQISARLYPDLWEGRKHEANSMVAGVQTVLRKLIHGEEVTRPEAEACRDTFIQAYNAGKSEEEQLRVMQQEDPAPVFNFFLEQGKTKPIALYSTKTHPRGKYPPTTHREPSTGTALPLSLPEAPISMDQLVDDVLRGNHVTGVDWEQPKGTSHPYVMRPWWVIS